MIKTLVIIILALIFLVIGIATGVCCIAAGKVNRVMEEEREKQW